LTHPPMKLSALDSEEERARWKVVRTDYVNGGEVHPGSLILSASRETGLCLFRLADGSNKEESFGPDGIMIVRARR
jgi:hypothetical protein